ncbi:MAG: hypothetical protein ACE5IJ_05305 [Thermoplasmata archaeon]
MRSRRTSESILAVTVYVPVLLIRLFFQFLRFESRKKKAVRMFRRELRAQNMGKRQIDLLTREYESAGSVRKLISNLGRSGSILHFTK